MNKILREKLKVAYKNQKKGDLTGKNINKLVQQIHAEKKMEQPNKEKLQSLVEQIFNLSQQRGFRREFPTFVSFKNFMKQQKLTLEDLT